MRRTTRQAPDKTSGDFSEIRHLARRILSPANYFAGVGRPEGKLPGNVLCFARHRGSAVSGVPTHHHRCVLLVAARGSGRVCVDADNFLLQEGEAVMIFPFQFHSYMEVQPGPICWVFITFETLSLAELEPLRSSPARRFGLVEALLLREALGCWLDAPHTPRHALLPLHLGLLLGRLAAMGGARLKSPPGSPASPHADLLARVNGYVLPRLEQPLGLAELAHAMGQSESHLRKRFREATGESLGRHLRELRFQRACSFLHTTALPIGEIAERCGFESVYAFSRAFKTARGISPRSYRQTLIPA